MICVILLLPNNYYAQSENHETSLVGENHFNYNNIALFIGASSMFEKEETHITLGADYVRYFSPESNFAVGIYGEAIFAHNTEWVLGTVLVYDLTEHLWVRTGPGIEIKQEDLECGCGTESITEFLFRVGTGYAIHIDMFIISPSIDVDFLRSTTTLVWGLNFGISF